MIDRHSSGHCISLDGKRGPGIQGNNRYKDSSGSWETCLRETSDETKANWQEDKKRPTKAQRSPEEPPVEAHNRSVAVHLQRAQDAH